MHKKMCEGEIVMNKSLLLLSIITMYNGGFALTGAGESTLESVAIEEGITTFISAIKKYQEEAIIINERPICSITGNDDQRRKIVAKTYQQLLADAQTRSEDDYFRVYAHFSAKELIGVVAEIASNLTTISRKSSKLGSWLQSGKNIVKKNNEEFINLANAFAKATERIRVFESSYEQISHHIAYMLLYTLGAQPTKGVYQAFEHGTKDGLGVFTKIKSADLEKTLIPLIGALHKGLENPIRSIDDLPLLGIEAHLMMMTFATSFARCAALAQIEKKMTEEQKSNRLAEKLDKTLKWIIKDVVTPSETDLSEEFISFDAENNLKQDSIRINIDSILANVEQHQRAAIKARQPLEGLLAYALTGLTTINSDQSGISFRRADVRERFCTALAQVHEKRSGKTSAIDQKIASVASALIQLIGTISINEGGLAA